MFGILSQKIKKQKREETNEVQVEEARAERKVAVTARGPGSRALIPVSTATQSTGSADRELTATARADIAVVSARDQGDHAPATEVAVVTGPSDRVLAAAMESQSKTNDSNRTVRGEGHPEDREFIKIKEKRREGRDNSPRKARGGRRSRRTQLTLNLIALRATCSRNLRIPFRSD